VFPMRYKLDFYIPEEDILNSHCRENLKSYIYRNYLTKFKGPVKVTAHLGHPFSFLLQVLSL
jgi:hypothetical protein